MSGITPPTQHPFHFHRTERTSFFSGIGDAAKGFLSTASDTIADASHGVEKVVNACASLSKNAALDLIDDDSTTFEKIQAIPVDVRRVWVLWAVQENRIYALGRLLSGDLTLSSQNRKEALEAASEKGHLLACLILLVRTTPELRTVIRDGFLLLQTAFNALLDAGQDLWRSLNTHR